MKLNGNLKKQVEETTNKESLIEQAGMPLTDDELNMVSGGNLIPRVFRCGSCNRDLLVLAADVMMLLLDSK